MDLVLASASPRRQELLRNAGIPFRVSPADLPEEPRDGEAPADYACRLALEKARAVWQGLGTEQSPQQADTGLVGAPHEKSGGYVLGADTIVVVEGAILGKPRHNQDARRMLRLLSGRSHQVMTGVCLIAPGGIEDVRLETTCVRFSELHPDEVEFYVSTGEPMDKAGAYAIQGIASRWIVRIEGCYFNVVGLPVPLVWRMLQKHGASIGLLQ